MMDPYWHGCHSLGILFIIDSPPHLFGRKPIRHPSGLVIGPEKNKTQRLPVQGIPQTRFLPSLASQLRILLFYKGLHITNTLPRVVQAWPLSQKTSHIRTFGLILIRSKVFSYRADITRGILGSFVGMPMITYYTSVVQHAYFRAFIFE